MERYGATWNDNASPVEIERHCIRAGGRFFQNGRQCGAGLFTHYKNLQLLLWPEDYHNRWTDWILRLLLKERIIVLFGCKDSTKTRTVSKWALCDYWSAPQETLSLMTSTTSRGLELRVWGDIKSLWTRATSRWENLEGNPVDNKYGIFTDDIGTSAKARDMRKGIIGIPTLTSEEAYDGSALTEFAGIKQGNRRLIGDELQFIPCDYLKVLFAMNAGNFKGVFMGNLIPDNGKALDRIAEPACGWGNLEEVKRTSQWRNKYGGVTLNLVGTDSPNLDPETKNFFPGMITQDSIDRAAKLPGAKDSVEWWSQILGVRKAGVISDRVLTIELCENNGAFKEVIWNKEPELRIVGVDAGYGGDDCVETFIECGEEVGGASVIRFVEQKVVPVEVSSPISAEDQIATHVKDDCQNWGVPDANVFIEAGMRATLGISFSRIMSAAISAVNFGGPATSRPVSNDLFIFDDALGVRRLKTCYEHYSKFVTELAFSVRVLVECGQARSFPSGAADEFQKRKTRYVYGERHELETKIQYKERNSGKSPNYSDSVMIAVEGARRLGFSIQRLPTGEQAKQTEDDWLQKEVEAQRKLERKRELIYESSR